MADATGYRNRNQCRKCSAFRARSEMSTQRTTHSRTARRSSIVSAAVCDTGTGREQPSGAASGRQRPKSRGVAHAPAPSLTPAKCVSCAAQNAALVVLPLSFATRRCGKTCERSPSGTLVHRPSVSTDNLAFPNSANHRSSSRPPSRRQPFQRRSLKPGRKALRKTRRSTSEMPSGSDHPVVQSVRGGGGDDTLHAWRERPRLWPRA